MKIQNISLSMGKCQKKWAPRSTVSKYWDSSSRLRKGYNSCKVLQCMFIILYHQGQVCDLKKGFKRYKFIIVMMRFKLASKHL